MMKSIVRLFTFLVIAFAAIQSNVNAQETVSEAEKKEVKKFVDDFIKHLDKTKDLDKVPERFFVSDFKTRFAKNEYWFQFLSSSDFYAQLSDSERFEGNVLTLNFLYLLLTSGVGSNQLNFDENMDLEDGDIDFSKIFPPNVIELIKKSKKWSVFLESDDLDDEENNSELNSKNYTENGNLAEWYELAEDMKNISEAQRLYLNGKSNQWRKRFEKNINKTRKKVHSIRVEKCDTDVCKDLPKDFTMICNAVFPFFIHLIQENSEWRILDIYPLLND
ncbi:MAG TPA: hypothetical protein PKE69_01475 [Pyrinomonadaceae bacterium]|nr:hypothetical protein [Pyrinomonadaceae bacterium]